jgi:hypothetical protein
MMLKVNRLMKHMECWKNKNERGLLCVWKRISELVMN